MSHHKKTEHHVRFYKLLAQTTGMLVCAFFLFFLIGEGIPDIASGKGAELIPFLPVLLLPIAGYVITWFREQAGTWMILAGALAMAVYFVIVHNLKAAPVYVIPFAVTGLLFLLHLKKRKQLQNTKA
jgi:hypothetical protein